MKLTSRQRWSVYAVGLAIAIGATVLTNQADNDTAVVASAKANIAAEPASTKARGDGAMSKHNDLAIDGLPVRAHGGAANDPFSPRSWKQMAAQEAARDAPRLPPPAPQPPPLPFSYMGKLIEGKETTIFLTNDDRNYVARIGETIEGDYRVEEISEHGMVLTYLPLKRQQQLAFETDVLPGATSVASRGADLPDDVDVLERSNVDVASRPSLVDRAPRRRAVGSEGDE